MIGRRGFITGLISLVPAPAIVRAGSLMPVKVMIEPVRSLIVTVQDLGLSPCTKAFTTAFICGQEVRLLEVDRVIMDRFGPGARQREELAFLRTVWPTATSIRAEP